MLKNNLEESLSELLKFGILILRSQFNSNSKEIVLPFTINSNLLNCKTTVPIRGDKKTLLDSETSLVLSSHLKTVGK